MLGYGAAWCSLATAITLDISSTGEFHVQFHGISYYELFPDEIEFQHRSKMQPAPSPTAR